jgi:hypothetical protein
MIQVVNVTMSRSGSTSRALTVPVPGDDGSALRSRPHSGLSADVQDFRLGAEDDASDRAVTGDHPQQVDVDDGAVFGLMEATCDTLQSVEVGVDNDVWLFPANCRCGPVVQPVPTQVLQGVVTTLPWCPGVTFSGRSHVGVDAGEERFPA